MSSIIFGLDNQNEFFSNHYLNERLREDLKERVDTWQERSEADGTFEPPDLLLSDQRRAYLAMKDGYLRQRAPAILPEVERPIIEAVLHALGYSIQADFVQVGDDKAQEVMQPVSIVRDAAGHEQVYVFEVYGALPEASSILDRTPTEEQYQARDSHQGEAFGLTRVVPASVGQENARWEALISERIFALSSPPRWVLLVAADGLVLVDRSKWAEKRFLALDFDELYDHNDRDSYRAAAALFHRESLVAGDEQSLLDTLNTQSHRHAYGVSQDLKYALRESVELLGNEAVRQLGLKAVADAEDELSLECLRYMYRLLFLFFVESRPELEYAPVQSDLYLRGYSLERLRDIAERPAPQKEQDKEGFYLHESVQRLFRLIAEGFTPGARPDGESETHDTFWIEPIRSHLFDDERMPFLSQVRFPNRVMHRVLELMSLSRSGASSGGQSGGSRGKKRSRRGRISYAQLGINQLGAVYEALLSYRGFVAAEDLYEVAPAGNAGTNRDPLEQAYFIPETRLSDYKKEEIVTDREGNFVRYPRGSFIYRLAGRNRQASASYYTPESLTELVVRFTLRERTQVLSADELLDLTILEPAMGSAAFLNETLNQLAELYLRRKQEETGKQIPHNDYMQERQKVKMYM
ncbi:MAG: hypothetical protein ACOC0B_01725, partial [bacterium]